MSKTYLVQQILVDENGEYDPEDGSMKFVVTWRRSYDLSIDGPDDGEHWMHMPDEADATHWMLSDVFDTKSAAEACRAAK